MGKAPAFQFYPADWVQDTAHLSLAARGAWIDILCALWRSSTRGAITLSIAGWARVLRATADQADSVINELVITKTCEYVKSGNGDVTLSNRRMVREHYERELVKQRVSGFREKRLSNDDVTPYSSSSSASSTSKPNTFARPEPSEVKDYAKEIGFDLDGQKFVDYYESKGWMIGRAPMKSWKAAVRTWKHNGYGNGGTNAKPSSRAFNNERSRTDPAAFVL